MKLELWLKGHSLCSIELEIGVHLPRVGEEVRMPTSAKDQAVQMSQLFVITGITHEWNRGVVRLYAREVR